MWWIDEPLIRGSSSPTDEDLGRLRARRFSVAVSLLEENKQSPRYDKNLAPDAGWSISIPIAENLAPSLDQIRDFTARLTALPEGTRVLVFCESGIGRTAFMAAVYWIMKGVTADEATARMSEACSAWNWATAERQRMLDEYELLQRVAATKT